jgi:hypothetical protein
VSHRTNLTLMYLLAGAMWLLVAVLLSSCAHRAQPEPRKMTGIGWRAIEAEPGKFVLAAESSEARADALRWLCGKDYICATKHIGEMLTVERTAKQ